MPSPANLSAARAKAASWALQYGHQEPRWNRTTPNPPARSAGKWISPPPTRAKVRRGKDIAILQHHNWSRCLNCLALKVPAVPPRTAVASGNKVTSLIPPPRGVTISITSLLCKSSLLASQSGIACRSRHRKSYDDALEIDLATPAREITSRHGVDRRSLLPLGTPRDAVARNATSRICRDF